MYFTDLTWKMMSLSCRAKTLCQLSAMSRTLAWVKDVSLGSPVDPEVGNSTARSVDLTPAPFSCCSC